MKRPPGREDTIPCRAGRNETEGKKLLPAGRKDRFMNKRNKAFRLFVLLLAAVMVLSACSANALETARKKKKKTTAPTAAVTAAVTETPAPTPDASEIPEPEAEAQRIADYIFACGELPDNFLTKKEAQELGWNKYENYLSDVAPGMSLGGDRFGNYERKLPVVKGRQYYEADCFYREGPRNEYRIIYSDDGHVWYSDDHYNTFTELYPSEKNE